MRALVTGAAGFIGSHLSQRLLAEGHDVIGVDNLSAYYAGTLKRRNLAAIAHPRFTFVQDDLADADLGPLLDGVDVAYHLAGQPGVRSSWGETFADYARANVLATQRLLEAARCREGLRLVYASSSSVYGDAEAFPTAETVLPCPRSPYGVTKLAAEHLCGLYAANFGLSTVSLRFFTVYGPRQRPDMAFTRFLRAARDGQQVTIYGTGEQIRDFTYVDDIVEALVRSGTTPTPAGSVFNVSGGGSHSVNEVLEEIESIVGKPLNIHREAVARGDVRRTSGDTTALARAFGWRPRVQLREGLRRQWDWVSAEA
ncbi:NAD-dependent epimerase/dehydratase family protein [Microbacterium sp. RG1]|uniref:NAD-dependent epimerase/dehydratase family protein n=1 Tax=Microbacterium sp. RG1 TaxID=2489212 RepID=UPI0010CA208B|nr:NAD-dependent epimerase/dehydratase family protein [Microbacterium sp. RG1]QCQ15396.1 NAD-dependent epimerase/dehydratase family protein [Microbacterium sp. RG1]